MYVTLANTSVSKAYGDKIALAIHHNFLLSVINFCVSLFRVFTPVTLPHTKCIESVHLIPRGYRKVLFFKGKNSGTTIRLYIARLKKYTKIEYESKADLKVKDEVSDTTDDATSTKVDNKKIF